MALGAELLVLQGPVGDGEGGALSAALQQGAREQGSSGGDGSRRKGGGSEGRQWCSFQAEQNEKTDWSVAVVRQFKLLCFILTELVLKII